MERLSRIVREFVIIEGSCTAGITTLQTLSGGPPSSDLTYVLPKARSAISFAVALDQSVIPPYLMKKEWIALEKELIRANIEANGIALQLAQYLSQKGHPSVPVAANDVYRPSATEKESGYSADLYHPDISHRYMAIRSGVGHMGLSGHVITREQGANVILGTTVTTAELIPTPPLPVEENYCDDCRLCMAACISDFMHPTEKTAISLGGQHFEYASRRTHSRCGCSCGGYTGLHASGKWSTWSPGRFSIPKNDKDIPSAYQHMKRAHSKWPDSEGGRYYYYSDEKLRTTCANCQLVCCPDKDERKARYEMLTESGVVVQKEYGKRKAVSAEEAQKWFADMPSARRTLYEDQ